MVKNSFIEKTYVVGNSNVYQQHVIEIKKTHSEIYNKQVACPLAFPI